MRTAARNILAIIITAVAPVLIGCAPRAVITGAASTAQYDIQPPYDDDGEPALSRIGILEPEVFMYDVSAGGISEYRDDWSNDASRRVAVSAALKLVGFGYDAVILPDAGRARDFFRLKTKMRYHGTAFQSRYFANMGIAPWNDTLTFSIGPQDDLCDFYGVDGFLYVYGAQEKFSRLRRSIKGDNAPERTFMAAVLVERSGRVSWYRHLLVSGGLDMREEGHAMRMMGAMFE